MRVDSTREIAKRVGATRGIAPYVAYLRRSLGDERAAERIAEQAAALRATIGPLDDHAPSEAFRRNLVLAAATLAWDAVTRGVPYEDSPIWIGLGAAKLTAQQMHITTYVDYRRLRNRLADHTIAVRTTLDAASDALDGYGELWDGDLVGRSLHVELCEREAAWHAGLVLSLEWTVEALDREAAGYVGAAVEAAGGVEAVAVAVSGVAVEAGRLQITNHALTAELTAVEQHVAALRQLPDGASLGLDRLASRADALRAKILVDTQSRVRSGRDLARERIEAAIRGEPDAVTELTDLAVSYPDRFGDGFAAALARGPADAIDRVFRVPKRWLADWAIQVLRDAGRHEEADQLARALDLDPAESGRTPEPEPVDV